MADVSETSSAHSTAAGSDINLDEDQGIPTNLVYLAVIIGMVLIGLGVMIVVWVGRSQIFGGLISSVGFGLILSAFGNRVTGQWKSWSMAGAGAMVVVLFLLFTQFVKPDPAPPEFRKTGQILGDAYRAAEFRILDEQQLFTARDRNNNAIKFIFLSNRFRNPRPQIVVTPSPGTGDSDLLTLYGDGNAIAKRYFADNNLINWKFDLAKKVVTDGRDVIFKQDDFPDADQLTIRPQARNGFDLPNPLISVAHAQAPAANTAELLKQLQSDDAIARRNARDDLIVAGPDAIPDMMSALRQSPDDYRLKLGVSFSLAGMLRANLALKDQIKSKLTDKDIELLVAATADADNTVRLQATQLLFNLGDPRVVAPSLNAANSTKNAESLHNSVLILQSLYPNLTKSDQDRVRNQLGNTRSLANPKTDKLIDELSTAK